MGLNDDLCECCFSFVHSRTVVSFAVEQKLMTMNNLIIAQARMCNIVEAEHIPATQNLFYSHFGVLHARHIKSMLKIE